MGMIRGSLLAGFGLIVAITSRAFAVPGFQADGDPVIPPAVAAANVSILKITTPYYIPLKRTDVPAFRSAKNLTADGHRELDECETSGLDECMIPILSMEGTAFVDRKHPDAVWTNCHLVDAWVRYQKYRSLRDHDGFRERIRDLRIPVRVQDHAGTLLEERAEFHIEISHLHDGTGLRDSGCNLSDDAVRLRGPRIDRPALRWAPSEAAPGEATFIGGYPRATTERAAIRARDSDGQHFAWTAGRVFGPTDFEQELIAAGLSPEAYALARAGIYSLLLSNDGAEGMSGGPILNARGEVLGIFRGILPGPDARGWPIATVGISTGGLRFLEIYNGE